MKGCSSGQTDPTKPYILISEYTVEHTELEVFLGVYLILKQWLRGRKVKMLGEDSRIV